jgi:serine/threonine protein kinase
VTRYAPAVASRDAADGRGGGLSTASTAVEGASDLGSLEPDLRALVTAPEDPARLTPGVILDEQYRIDRAIGEGGMGVVYRARDLRLERDVAIKIGTAAGAAALARASREALALARLSHPNVVVVYQVGELGGRVYLAMELVDGGNARAWLRERERTGAEIVELYAAAGDGLAAAHQAGLVHRDFKPDNILVGGDGRARVADFGLARGARAPRAVLDEAVVGAVGDAITRTGAVMGTPAYMAPEQLGGEAVDARADQFAFCAALWEALYGVRPFAGRTPEQLLAAIVSESPRAGERAVHGIPRHVPAALARGLRAAPDERWPSMAPLLAELRRDPRARRRRLAAASVVVAAVAAGGAAIVLRGHADPCTDGADRVARVWSSARASRLAAAFARAGSPISGRLVSDRLDGYARAWAIAHRDACLATRVDGSQSEALLDRRMLCLDHARAVLETIVAPLEAGGKDAVERAPDALALLPDLSRCADVAQLSNQAPLPADPLRRAQIEGLDHVLASLRTSRPPGPASTLRATADAMVAGARATGWPPLVAHAIAVRAEVLDGALADQASADALADAAREAVAAGDDAEAGASMARLAWDLAHRDRAAEAKPWLDLARAEWRRLGQPAWLDERILSADAERLGAAGDPAAHLAAVEAWIAVDRRVEGSDPLADAERHAKRAEALSLVGRPLDAEREGNAAVDEAAAALGPNHPRVSRYASAAALLTGEAGHSDAAVALARRAVAIDETWYGRDDARVADSLHTLGSELWRHGDGPEGRAVLARALDLATRGGEDPTRLARLEGDVANAEDESGDNEAALRHYAHAEELARAAGASPLLIAQFDVSIAMEESQTGHPAEAVTHGQQALAAMEHALPPDSTDLANPLLVLGGASRELGRLDDAARYLERAVHILDGAVAPANGALLGARDELARTLVAQHRERDALAVLAPAMAVIDGGRDADPGIAAEIRLIDAEALWATGEQARARVQAAAARDAFAARGLEENRVEAVAWLRAHP